MAELFKFNDLPAFYLSSTLGLTIVKRKAWYGLRLSIKQGYCSAINYISLIIKGRKRLCLKQNATRLSIIKDILEKIIENKLVTVNELNIDTEFKIA